MAQFSLPVVIFTGVLILALGILSSQANDEKFIPGKPHPVELLLLLCEKHYTCSPVIIISLCCTSQEI